MPRTIPHILKALALILSIQQPTRVDLPAVFENDLIRLAIPIEGDTLAMYTDTGGKNFLYHTGLKKLGLKRSRKNLWVESGLAEILAHDNLPAPAIKEIHFAKDKAARSDGMFGREWFADKVWEFDYENKTLSWIVEPELNRRQTGRGVDLHFRHDTAGNHTHHLPRIEIVVGPDTLSMLFDTGAQAILSAKAQGILGEAELVATSFINATTFDHWRAKHPQWTFIANADRSFGRKADLIVVPEVKIGHKTVGPVAFVKRADSNFQVMSDYFMDAEIVGALGGNALRGLRKFQLDYQTEWLTFMD